MWRLIALALVIFLASCGTGYDADLLLTDEMEKMDWADAEAYTQSPEYQNVCLNAWRYAEHLLASCEEGGTIVLDLDQTVFDGVGFNSWLAERGLGYSLERQVEYMEAHVYDLMPYAMEFITWAQAAGWKVAFVTNRKPALTKATEWHLAHYGFGHIPVLFRTGERDKTSRIQSFPNVVLTIGDKRGDSVEGIPHVFLPNPIY